MHCIIWMSILCALTSHVSLIMRGIQRERDSFEDFDKRMGMRKQFVEDLQKQFPDLGLNYSIGGQISIDIFPQ